MRAPFLAVVTAITLSAGSAFAQSAPAPTPPLPPAPAVSVAPPVSQGPVFSTGGFSVTFPEGWKAKKITEGMISASSAGMSVRQASVAMYYGEISPNASQAERNKFRALQKKHSVYDYISKQDLKNSHWSSKVTTEHPAENISVERVDVEQLQGNKPVCSFHREYHTPKVELHLTYSQRGSCESAKGDFSLFIKSLVWNN